MTESDALAALQKENARLIALLEANGIEWRLVPEPEEDPPSPLELESSRVKARYVLGLTATPIRRDGQQPIIFMQCGPIRYTAAKPASAPHDLEVVPHLLHKRIDLPQEAGIQDVFRHLANDLERTAAIAAEIESAFSQGGKCWC